MLKMFIGEFQHNMDTKGRLIIPSKFREQLSETFVLTRGLDGCIFLYPDTAWENLQMKMKNLPLSKKNARAFVRFFYSAAAESSLDHQGRVRLPQTLIDYAKIEKACRIVGVNERIEIWSEASWQEQIAEISDDFEELSEDLFDFGI